MALLPLQAWGLLPLLLASELLPLFQASELLPLLQALELLPLHPSALALVALPMQEEDVAVVEAKSGAKGLVASTAFAFPLALPAFPSLMVIHSSSKSNSSHKPLMIRSVNSLCFSKASTQSFIPLSGKFRTELGVELGVILHMQRTQTYCGALPCQYPHKSDKRLFAKTRRKSGIHTVDTCFHDLAQTNLQGQNQKVRRSCHCCHVINDFNSIIII